MKSARRGGKYTGKAEVARIGADGLWLKLDGRELFMPFKEFPWFEIAPVREVFHVERLQSWHLHWPDLDVDLEVESIEHPERFPLKFGWPPASAGPRATDRGRRTAGGASKTKKRRAPRRGAA